MLVLKFTIGVRSAPEDEEEGLDIADHGERPATETAFQLTPLQQIAAFVRAATARPFCCL